MQTKLELKQLQTLRGHADITAVWLIEEEEGGYYLTVDYIGNSGQDVYRGVLYGREGSKRVWTRLDNAVNFWRTHVEDFHDITIKLNKNRKV